MDSSATDGREEEDIPRPYARCPYCGAEASEKESKNGTTLFKCVVLQAEGEVIPHTYNLYLKPKRGI